MFGFLFKQNRDLSKNSKIVKRWQAEHQALANRALKVVDSYEREDLKKARKHLDKLQTLALKHLMDEDVKFFELFKKAEDNEADKEILKSIKEFRNTFIDTKKVLFHFFIYYTNPKNDLDHIFKDKLNAIIDALVNRIEFEEKNLYILINN